MNQIFLGMLFVFLDLTLNINNCTIDFLPDFVGYILMMKGPREMESESACFTKSRPWAMGLAVYTGVLFAADLLGISADWGFMGWVLGLAATNASLVISYWIIKGIRQIESVRGFDLQGEKLNSLWMATAVIDGLCYLLVWVPLLGAMGALAGFIIGICYLVAFYRTKQLYLGYTGM